MTAHIRREVNITSRARLVYYENIHEMKKKRVSVLDTVRRAAGRCVCTDLLRLKRRPKSLFTPEIIVKLGSVQSRAAERDAEWAVLLAIVLGEMFLIFQRGCRRHRQGLDWLTLLTVTSKHQNVTDQRSKQVPVEMEDIRPPASIYIPNSAGLFTFQKTILLSTLTTQKKKKKHFKCLNVW